MGTLVATRLLGDQQWPFGMWCVIRSEREQRGVRVCAASERVLPARLAVPLHLSCMYVCAVCVYRCAERCQREK